MANVLAELFQNTADAIREKTGETGTMKPAEFPDKIRGITVGTTEEKPISYTLLSNPETITTGVLNDFVWHPDGTKALMLSTTGVYLYDTTTEPYTFIEILEGSTSSVSWSALYLNDATRLLVVFGGLDSTKVTIKIYDTTVSPYVLIDGLISETYCLNSYFGQGRWSALSPNGEILCITGEEGYILFDTTTSPYTLLYTQTETAQPEPPVFSVDGSKLYLFGPNALYTKTYSWGGSTAYYAITLTIAEDKSVTFTAGARIKNESTSAMLCFDGGKFASSISGSYLSFYTDDSATPFRALYDPLTYPWRLIMYDPTGRYLLSGGLSYTGLLLTEVLENGVRFYNPVQDYTLTSRCIRFSPDGKKVFVGSTDSSSPLYIYACE